MANMAEGTNPMNGSVNQDATTSTQQEIANPISTVPNHNNHTNTAPSKPTVVGGGKGPELGKSKLNALAAEFVLPPTSKTKLNAFAEEFVAPTSAPTTTPTTTTTTATLSTSSTTSSASITSTTTPSAASTTSTSSTRLSAAAAEFVPVSKWVTPPPPKPADDAKPHKYSLNFLRSFQMLCVEPPKDMDLPSHLFPWPSSKSPQTHLSRIARARSPSADNLVERRDLFFQQDLQVTRYDESPSKRPQKPVPILSPTTPTTPISRASSTATNHSTNTNSTNSKKQKRRSRGGRKSSSNSPSNPPTTPPLRPLRLTNDDSTFKACREMRLLLNKLTPENFERIAQAALAIEIDSAQCLQAVIQVLFEKAVAETQFCSAYADLCARLCDSLPDFTSNNKKQTFRRILLGLCYTHFISEGDSTPLSPFTPSPQKSNKNPNNDNTNNHNGSNGNSGQLLQTPTKQSISAKTPSSAGSLKANGRNSQLTPISPVADPILTTLELNMGEDEKRQAAKRRVMGNIHFIGALFMQGLLTEQIIRLCFDYALDSVDNPSDDDIESACRLLSSVGSTLQRTSSEYLIGIFEKLEIARNNPNLSSRLCFMIDDIKELRSRGWVPRRQPVVNPKPLSELRDKQNKQESGSDEAQQAMDELKQRSKKSGSKPWRPKPHTASNPSSPQLQKGISMEQWRRKAIMLVEEYCLIGDTKEACRCVRELNSPENSRLFVKVATINVLENDSRAVCSWAALLVALFEEELLATDDIHQGLSDVWERIQDLVIDVPLAPELLSVICGTVCGQGITTTDEMLSEVLVYCETVFTPQPLLFSKALQAAVQGRAEAVQQEWTDSWLTLLDLKLDESHLHHFEGLEFLFVPKTATLAE